MLRARLLALFDDARSHLRKRPVHQQLLRHAEISAPEDRHIGLADLLERALPIEHDEQRVHGLRPTTFTQLAARRHQERRADVVERNAVRAAQHLHGRDARHHTHLLARQAEAGRDAQGAVVKCRIAPYQQGDTATACGQFFIQSGLPAMSDGVVPFVDLLVVIIALRAAQRHVEMRHAVERHFQLFKQGQPHLRKLGLVVFLVRQQHQVCLANGVFRFARDVVGVAGADADQQQFKHHRSSLPTGKRGSAPRGR